MASMTRRQRAEHYLKLLLESRNQQTTFQEILNELNGLVYAKTNEPLSKQDKIAIIEDLETIFQELPQTRNKSWEYSTNASDNSGVIDIIGALKRGVKD